MIEVDYYNATSLLGLSDEQLIQRTLHTYLATCQPAYGLCQVKDSSVLRCFMQHTLDIHIKVLPCCYFANFSCVQFVVSMSSILPMSYTNVNGYCVLRSSHQHITCLCHTVVTLLLCSIVRANLCAVRNRSKHCSALRSSAHCPLQRVCCRFVCCRFAGAVTAFSLGSNDSLASTALSLSFYKKQDLFYLTPTINFALCLSQVCWGSDSIQSRLT